VAPTLVLVRSDSATIVQKDDASSAAQFKNRLLNQGVKAMAPSHTIEARPIENRYARGWHCVGSRRRLPGRKPHTIEAFGTHLVAFAGEDGRRSCSRRLLPAHGERPGKGAINGNSVVCPFHHWSCGAGRQVHNNIPYCNGFLPKPASKPGRSQSKEQSPVHLERSRSKCAAA